MSTVFSSGSPISPDNESQDLSTLAAFVAHIERLQDQVRQKDAQTSELEMVKEELRKKYERLEQDHQALNLQMDIQNDLLRKTRRTDKHIEQLRAAVIDRETIIGEKETSIRAIEKQLEYHKLLLQSQIRRHAVLTLHDSVKQDTLPDLEELVARKDIDRWIERLHQRLKQEQAANHDKDPINPAEAQLAGLREEIDFYVREIIFYKLDIRGYKSDIKKLKKITTQLSSHGSRTSDLESDTSSLRPPVTPNRSRFPSATSELGATETPLRAQVASTSEPTSMASPITAQPGPEVMLDVSSPTGGTDFDYKLPSMVLDIPVKDLPKTPSRRADRNRADEAESVDPGVSPRSVVNMSPQRRKPMVC